MAKVLKEKCLGCGVCLPSCPVNAISMPDNIAVIDEKICTNCGACITACPQEAIVMDSDSKRISPLSSDRQMRRELGRGMGRRKRHGGGYGRRI